MKRTLVLVTAMAVGAAVSAATKGSSEATAISLTASAKEKTATVQLVQDSTTNGEHFVCYYKMTLTKGTAYTIWLDNAAINGKKSQSATISIPPFSIYPKFSFASPIALFEAVEVGDSVRWVMSGKEWSSTVADDDWGDSSLGSSSSEFDFDWDWKTPNTWTYYIVVQGQKGETATLHYSTGKKIPPGILQNPLVVTPPVLPKTLTTGALKFCSSNYFAQVKFRKGARYHFSSTGGTAANRLHISYLDADGHAVLPGTVRSAAAGYNFSETFVPDKSGTFLLRISSSAENYENATAHLVCGVEPEKAIAKHAVRGLGAGAPVTCRPGNVNAKGSTYFDAIIDEMNNRFMEQAGALNINGMDPTKDADIYKNMNEESMIELGKSLFLYYLHDNYTKRFRKMLTIEQFHDKDLAADSWSRKGCSSPTTYRS